MDIRKYFSPGLLSEKGPLSKSLRPDVIRAANKAIKETETTQKSGRGTYSKFSPEKQAEIARYATHHGNKAAVRHFAQALRNKYKGEHCKCLEKEAFT